MIGKNNISMKESAITIENSLAKAFRFRNTRLEALYDLVEYLYYTERGGVLFYRLEKVRQKVMISVKACKAYR